MQKLDQYQENNDIRILSGPGSTLFQSFRPAFENLTGIRLFVYNPNLGGDKSFMFSILDDSGRVIRQQLFSESNMGWAEKLRFDFLPVKESKNKVYILKIDYEGETSSSGITAINMKKTGSDPSPLDRNESETENKFPSFAYSKKDNYLNGFAKINGITLPGDFVFSTYYKTTPSEFIASSLNMFGKKLIADPFFVIFYVTSILMILVLLFRKKKNYFRSLPE